MKNPELNKKSQDAYGVHALYIVVLMVNSLPIMDVKIMHDEAVGMERCIGKTLHFL